MLQNLITFLIDNGLYRLIIDSMYMRRERFMFFIFNFIIMAHDSSRLNWYNPQTCVSNQSKFNLDSFLFTLTNYPFLFKFSVSSFLANWSWIDAGRKWTEVKLQEYILEHLRILIISFFFFFLHLFLWTRIHFGQFNGFLNLQKKCKVSSLKY